VVLAVLSGLEFGGSPPAGAAAPSVRTIVAGLQDPTGLAFDAAGDLFVADTDQCRIVVVPSQTGVLYGQRVRKLRPSVLFGSHCGKANSLRYPTGLVVNAQGDLFIAEATVARVVMLRPTGPRRLVDIAGTGQSGYNGDGRFATQTELNEPSGLAVDRTGDLFIADTANCRVREVPDSNVDRGGQAMTPLRIYTVAGTGVCGSVGRPGPASAGQLWDPVALASDPSGDLTIADEGDQSVLQATAAGQLTLVAGTGGNGPYLQDGLSATGVAAELNDPEGVALSAIGTVFIADGAMSTIRFVPAVSGTIAGRPVSAGDMYTLAGALPVTTSAGLGNGTKWIITHMDRPTGIVISPFGGVFYSDAGTGQVREIT
jgi:hypothetical protein